MDAWHNETLVDGTVVEAAYPGLSNYTVPEGTFDAVGRVASRYGQGVQIGPSTNPGYEPYRPEALRLRMNGDVNVASSTALANPQFGPGGLGQHYIPGIDAKLVSGEVQIVDGAGHPVPVTADPLTHKPQYTLPGEATIPLSHFDTMPSLPSLHPLPVMHQTLSRTLGSGWTVATLGGDR